MLPVPSLPPLQPLTCLNRPVDPQGLVAFFGSMGWVATVPGEDRQQLLDKMRSQLTATEYVLPWQTRVQWTRLRAPA